MGNRARPGGARVVDSGVGPPCRHCFRTRLRGHPGAGIADRCGFDRFPREAAPVVGGLAGMGPGQPRNCSRFSRLRASRKGPEAGMGDNGRMTTIVPKTPAEIEKMRVAGRLAAEVLQVVAPHVKPGGTTEELDRICHDHIVNVQGAIPANVGYRGYPKTVCTSVNNVICHGITSEAKVLKAGAIVK